jgi:hypothetical protein
MKVFQYLRALIASEHNGILCCALHCSKDGAANRDNSTCRGATKVLTSRITLTGAKLRLDEELICAFHRQNKSTRILVPKRNAQKAREEISKLA